MPQPESAQPTSDGLSVEFRCADCGQLLRVSSGAVGRSVRCPQCQETMEVPGTATAAAPPDAMSAGNGDSAASSDAGPSSTEMKCTLVICMDTMMEIREA